MERKDLLKYDDLDVKTAEDFIASSQIIFCRIDTIVEILLRVLLMGHCHSKICITRTIRVNQQSMNGYEREINKLCNERSDIYG